MTRGRAWLVTGAVALTLALAVPPHRTSACSVREQSPREAFHAARAVLLFEVLEVGPENLGQTLRVRVLRVFKSEGRRIRPGDVIDVDWFDCNSGPYASANVGTRELRAMTHYQNRLMFAWYSARWTEDDLPRYLRRAERSYQSAQ